MKYLPAKHYLEIYSSRMSMQSEGITNPSESIKEFTKILVSELSKIEDGDPIDLKRTDGGIAFIHVPTGKVLSILPEREYN